MREIKREREREIFCLLIYFPNDKNSQSCDKLKLGAWGSIWVSHVRVRFQVLGPSFTASQVRFQESWLEVERPEPKPTLTSECQYHKHQSSGPYSTI